MSALRFLTKVGWIIPLVWILGGGWPATLGHLTSAYLLVGIGLVQFPLRSFYARVSQRRVPLVLYGLAMVPWLIVTGGLVAFYQLTNNRVGVSALVVDAVLMLASSVLALRVVQGEPNYAGILEDFRMGLLLLVFLIGVAFVTTGRQHLSFQPLSYAGIVCYVLLGAFGLAFARRFAIDETVKDDRESALDPEWLLTVAGLLGGLAVVGLIFIQLFSFDLVTAAANLLRPEGNLIGWVGTGIANLTVGVLGFILRVLGLHQLSPKAHGLTHVKSPGKKHPINQKPIKVRPLPGWTEMLLKVIGLGVAGLVALIALTAVIRRLSGIELRGLRGGERRVREWSWKRLFRWGTNSAKDAVSGATSGLRWPIHRSRRPRTVREVYRAFLSLGNERDRAKELGETGLEYSLHLKEAWTDSSGALDDLNRLYNVERYGSEPSEASQVQEAMLDLEVLQRVAVRE